MAVRPPTERPSSKDASSRATSSRGTALGVELAASIVGFALLGLWIDHTYDTGPWGTLICVVLGTVGGFYNFLHDALRILRPPALRSGGASSRQEGSADESPPDARSDRNTEH